jgi:hypothetical protein
MQDMLGGQQIECPMHVRFEASGTMFDLRMNPLNYAGTNVVNVKCISPTTSSGGPCSTWHILPSVTYEYTDPVDGLKTGLRNVARLSYGVTAKGKTTDVIQGLFHVSFSILVVKQ